MAKPAAKRVKVEKGADSEPTPTEAPAAAPVPTEAPAAAPVKEEKKPARPKTAAEVAHEAEMKARSDPYKGRALARGVQIKTSARRRHDVLAHRTTGREPAVRTWSTTTRMTRNRSSSRATASSSSATTSSSTRTSRRTRTRASRRCRVTAPPSFFGTDNYKLVIRRRRRPRRRRPELEPPDVAEALLGFAVDAPVPAEHIYGPVGRRGERREAAARRSC